MPLAFNPAAICRREAAPDVCRHAIMDIRSSRRWPQDRQMTTIAITLSYIIIGAIFRIA
jgi:hypothetical protein